MADEEHKGSDGMPETVTFVVGLMLVLIALWYVRGGRDLADLRGIFLAPPAPLGSGDAYGPTPGAPATSTDNH